VRGGYWADNQRRAEDIAKSFAGVMNVQHSLPLTPWGGGSPGREELTKKQRILKPGAMPASVSFNENTILPINLSAETYPYYFSVVLLYGYIFGPCIDSRLLSSDLFSPWIARSVFHEEDLLMTWEVRRGGDCRGKIGTGAMPLRREFG